MTQRSVVTIRVTCDMRMLFSPRHHIVAPPPFPSCDLDFVSVGQFDFASLTSFSMHKTTTIFLDPDFASLTTHPWFLTPPL